MVQCAMDAIHLGSVSVWPYYVGPNLKRWSYEISRVVTLGGAAHAISPVASRGINQGLEDVHSPSLLAKGVKSSDTWRARLD